MKTLNLTAFYAPMLKPNMLQTCHKGQAEGMTWKSPVLSPQQIKSLCLQLKENARNELFSLSQKSIAQDLGKLSRLWLNKNYPHRKKTEEILAAASGCSLKNIREGLNLAFKEVSVKKILSSSPLMRPLPQGGLTYCVFAGIISTPMLFDIFLSLLRKSAVLAKSPTREPFFPIQLAESLHEISPALGKCVAALWWPGGQAPMEKEIFRQASFINVYGDDSTVAKMSSYAAPDKTFIPLGHKVSLSFASKRCLKTSHLGNLARRMAYDVSLYDQQGCLSPHVIYIEKSPGFDIRHFLHHLAMAMEKIKLRMPPGRLSFAEASRIHQVRGEYQFKQDSLCITSRSKTDWTLIYEKDDKFHPSCLNRVIFVKLLERMESLKKILKNWEGKIQGLAYETDRTEEKKIHQFADDFDIPVCRPIGQIQRLRFQDHIRERLRVWNGKKP